MIFAQIRFNRVHIVKEYAEMPTQGEWVNVDNVNPQPVANDYYDRITGIFSKNNPVPITVISRESFWDRFTEVEQETLANHGHAKVKAFLNDLRMRNRINLKSTRIVSAVNAMENAGIIGQGRAVEILA